MKPVTLCSVKHNFVSFEPIISLLIELFALHVGAINVLNDWGVFHIQPCMVTYVCLVSSSRKENMEGVERKKERVFQCEFRVI